MSVHPAPPVPVANDRRRCRQRPIAASSPRPSELLRLFFLTGLGFIAASALAGIADAAAGTDWLHWLALHLLLLGGIRSWCSAPDSSSCARSWRPIRRRDN